MRQAWHLRAAAALAVAIAAALLLPPAAFAQAKKPPDPMPLNQIPQSKSAAGKPPATYYDIYQASHRQRLRRESCMRDEDLNAQYCVKKCRDGYVALSGQQIPRMCRSEKPLPPGQLPTGDQVERGTVVIPPKRSGPAPTGS